MLNSEVMKNCESYIDEHLEFPPSAQELANMAGYSLYHFCHLFRAHFGVSVGEYIISRKLAKAAENIKSGMCVTEASMRAGYDTPSGFAKAFRKVYGVNASEYRAKASMRAEMSAEPVFISKAAFSAVGYCIAPEEKEIKVKDSGAYWHGVDFSKYPKYPVDLEGRGEIAAWVHPDSVRGELSYFFGFESDDTAAPEGFALIIVPGADYAVFEAPATVSDKDFSGEIKKLWQYVFDEWFDSSTKKFDEEKMCFEYYLGEKGYIYVPVK